MAAIQNLRFVPFTLPLPAPTPRNKVWPSKTTGSIPLPTNCQKTFRPAAILTLPGYQAKAEGNAPARAVDWEHARADINDESHDVDLDGDIPSLEKGFRTAPYRRDDGSNLTMIRDGDEPLAADTRYEAEDSPGGLDPRHIEQDMTPYNTVVASNLASKETKSLDTSGLWYDVEEGRWIEEPVLGLQTYQQPQQPDPQYLRNVSIPTQSQLLSLSSKPLQEQIDQLEADNIAQLRDSPQLLSPTHSQLDSSHSTSPNNEMLHRTSRTSQSPSPSTPSSSIFSDEPEVQKLGRKHRHQDTHTEMNSEIYRVENNYDHDTSDLDEEDPRPAQRRRPRLTSAVASPLYPQWSRSLVSISSCLDDAQPHSDHEDLPSLVVNQHSRLRTPLNSTVVADVVPAAEYQEYPFQGILKHTRIGNTMSFSLEFDLSYVPENVELLALFERLLRSVSTSAQHHTSSATAHPSARRVDSRPPKKRLL